MTRGILITEDQLEAVNDYIKELYFGSELESLTKEERRTYFDMWKGARRTLRRLGIRCSELEEMFSKEEVKTA